MNVCIIDSKKDNIDAGFWITSQSEFFIWTCKIKTGSTQKEIIKNKFRDRKKNVIKRKKKSKTKKPRNYT